MSSRQSKEDSATERQREYAIALGLTFPADITKSAMSELISKKVDNDGDPNPGLMDFARAHGIDFSPFVGKRALYNRIFGLLSNQDKARFFVFSIYRWLSEDREANLEVSTKRDELDIVARQLLGNPKALKSLLRYEGQDLRFFGEATFAGMRCQGGSDKTIAYREACQLLKARSLLPAVVRARRNRLEARAESPELFAGKYSLGLPMIVTALLVLAVAYWLLGALGFLPGEHGR